MILIEHCSSQQVRGLMLLLFVSFVCLVYVSAHHIFFLLLFKNLSIQENKYLFSLFLIFLSILVFLHLLYYLQPTITSTTSPWQTIYFITYSFLKHMYILTCNNNTLEEIPLTPDSLYHWGLIVSGDFDAQCNLWVGVFFINNRPWRLWSISTSVWKARTQMHEPCGNVLALWSNMHLWRLLPLSKVHYLELFEIHKHRPSLQFFA